ncbi:MAG: M23 family metallopeptidase [Actinomycetota bacterium]|nr:M23 family metallopeptidase [Actinomycetota bacterium]
MTPRTKQQSYAGRRVAGRSAGDQPDTVELTAAAGIAAVVETAPAAAYEAESATHHFNDLDVTAEMPLAKAGPGRRRADRHSGFRGPLSRGLPSAPVLLGVAALAISIGGAITSAGPDLAGNDSDKFQFASALSGSSGVGSVSAYTDRARPVSRDSQRDALDEAANADLVAEAEQQARQRDAALGKLAKSAEGWASKLAENQWVLPLAYSEITATFGEYGLWSSYHTGLDFNGDTGDQIMAIANGTITETGYDGSYGNKTVLTLDDGTEIWFCHQTEIFVEPGETVTAGDVIGTVGTTGNVTGSHLHVEVRPGGGDPVDPYAAFVVHGVTP